jgi:hypothetical protein
MIADTGASPDGKVLRIIPSRSGFMNAELLNCSLED